MPTLTSYLHRLGEKVPGSIVVAVGILAAAIIFTTTSVQSNDKADRAVVNSVALGSTISQLCAGSRGPEIALILRDTKTDDGKPVCDRAGDTLRDPTATPVAVSYVPDARIIALIHAEIAKLPPPASSAPSLEQVTAAVRTVMSTDPVFSKGVKGDPGTPVSQADIAAAVADYFRANRDQFRGEPGKSGADGKDGRDGQQGQTVTVTRTPPTETVTESAPTVTETQEAPPEETHEDPAPPQSTATENSSRQRGGLGGLLNRN